MVNSKQQRYSSSALNTDSLLSKTVINSLNIINTIKEGFELAHRHFSYYVDQHLGRTTYFEPNKVHPRGVQG